MHATTTQFARPTTNRAMSVTKEQCERAVDALRKQGFEASHVQGAPNDHGVWLDGVWNDKLEEAQSFRIHDEEIEYWMNE